MPRNGRGGRRSGTPGKAYANRSDLQRNPAPTQPVRAPTGLPYGEAKALRDAQKAAPLPQAPPVPRQSAPAQLAGTAAPPPLNAPTERPSEPLTAGIPMGAGPGPEVLHGGGDPNDPVSMLRVLYQLYPYDEIRELLEKADEQSYDQALAAPPQRDVATQMGTQGAAMASTPAAP